MWTSLHMLWISCNMSRDHESKLLGGWWWGKQAASWEDCMFKAGPQGLAKGFPGGAVVKNLPARWGDARDTGLIPGWGRSPKGATGNPLQYSCPENAMDRGAWWATIHGVSKSQARLSNWAWATSLAGIQIKETESQGTMYINLALQSCVCWSACFKWSAFSEQSCVWREAPGPEGMGTGVRVHLTNSASESPGFTSSSSSGLGWVTSSDWASLLLLRNLCNDICLKRCCSGFKWDAQSSEFTLCWICCGVRDWRGRFTLSQFHPAAVGQHRAGGWSHLKSPSHISGAWGVAIDWQFSPRTPPPRPHTHTHTHTHTRGQGCLTTRRLVSPVSLPWAWKPAASHAGFAALGFGMTQCHLCCLFCESPAPQFPERRKQTSQIEGTQGNCDPPQWPTQMSLWCSIPFVQRSMIPWKKKKKMKSEDGKRGKWGMYLKEEKGF